MLKRIFLIEILVVTFIIIGEGSAFAGLSVDPVTLEVIALKEIGKTGIIKIGNTGDKPLQIEVCPEKWAGQDRDVKTWIEFDPMKFIVEPVGTKDVTYKITPPSDSGGELRCMVFFEANEVGKEESMIGIRFGVPVYAIVGGTEVVDVEIKSIDLTYGFENRVLNGTILINNKSNIHIRPNIEIQIFDSRDKLVAWFSLPYGQPAQAGQNRPFIFQQNLELAPGKYKLVTKVDYGRLYGLADKIAGGKRAFIVRIPVAETGEVKKDEEKK